MILSPYDTALHPASYATCGIRFGIILLRPSLMRILRNPWYIYVPYCNTLRERSLAAWFRWQHWMRHSKIPAVTVWELIRVKYKVWIILLRPSLMCILRNPWYIYVPYCNTLCERSLAARFRCWHWMRHSKIPAATDWDCFVKALPYSHFTVSLIHLCSRR